MTEAIIALMLLDAGSGWLPKKYCRWPGLTLIALKNWSFIPSFVQGVANKMYYYEGKKKFEKQREEAKMKMNKIKKNVLLIMMLLVIVIGGSGCSFVEKLSFALSNPEYQKAALVVGEWYIADKATSYGYDMAMDKHKDLNMLVDYAEAIEEVEDVIAYTIEFDKQLQEKFKSNPKEYLRYKILFERVILKDSLPEDITVSLKADDIPLSKQIKLAAHYFLMGVYAANANQEG